MAWTRIWHVYCDSQCTIKTAAAAAPADDDDDHGVMQRSQMLLMQDQIYMCGI